MADTELTDTPLAGAALVGFIPVTDLGRARAFYESTLGLPVTLETPDFLVLDSGGRDIRVNLVADHAPWPQTICGWQVDDIAATVAALTAAGVAFARYDFVEQDDQGIWTTPGGDQVAWFLDPDGNNLSLQQPA